MAKARKGERLASPSKSEISFAGLLRDDDEHGEAEQRHEQISDEIKRDGLAIEARHANEQITRVRDARVREQAFEIILRECGQISVKQCEQRDQ